MLEMETERSECGPVDMKATLARLKRVNQTEDMREDRRRLRKSSDHSDIGPQPIAGDDPQSPVKLVSRQGQGYKIAESGTTLENSASAGFLAEDPGSPIPKTGKPAYFTTATKKIQLDRRMVRVENQMFCSDWEKAERLVSFERKKIRDLVTSEDNRKPLDTESKQAFYEALLHSPYISANDPGAGSFQEFGFIDKIADTILDSAGFSLLLYDLTHSIYSQLYCKPSLTKKTLFLDDDVEVHNMKEVISEFCQPSTATVALLFHVSLSK